MRWMKRLAAYSVVLIMLFPMISCEAAAKKNALVGMDTYKIYYSEPTKKILSQMSNYDFVIIEPNYYSAAQIKQIQAGGTLVFGYISTMEAPNWNKAFMQKLQPQDYMYRNGQKVHYSKWDSYLMNISSSHYQQVLMDEIQAQIAAKGFNGVFLDTVGDIDDEYSKLPTLLKEQRAGMVSFLKTIESRYPELLLIQNWGLPTLKEATAPYVDAIMWENFNYNVVSKNKWSLEQITMLQGLKKSYSLEVLTVSTKEEAKSRSFAKKQGFIHYHASKGYSAW